MASKRTINRCYWAAVKQNANIESDTPRYRQSLSSVNATTLFEMAIAGAPDRQLINDLSFVESKLGKHNPHVDLANRDLWPARQIIDAIRFGGSR